MCKEVFQLSKTFPVATAILCAEKETLKTHVLTSVL